MEDKENSRLGNFSNEEVDALVNLVKKYKHIIEFKKSDAVMWKDKEKIWQQIAIEFNELSIKPIKQKCERYKTGGGVASPVPIRDIDKDIKDIVGVSVTGLINVFDSDAVPCSLLQDHNYTANDTAITEDTPFILPEALNFAPNNVVIDEVVISKDQCETEGMDWSSWNPTLLRTPITRQLQVTPSTCTGKLEDVSTAVSTGAVATPRKKLKKTQLNEDCRIKINMLSEAKLQLVEIQRDAAKKEMEMKLEEHTIKMEMLLQEKEFQKKKQELKLKILQKSLQID
ncbi:uncharacterized protein LOC116160411 [Photinus pyralis]|uniref:uncharacterized protein LOC116160411 n=1 Tax=Photinus pyralis TaxID=7054 RepID=UPI0012677AD9|nr:uncharacterized protein LOC116160411 [Photinus pyralis]